MLRLPRLSALAGVAAACTSPSLSHSKVETPKSREALWATLLSQRTVMLSGPVTEESSRQLIAQLLYLVSA